MRGLIYFLYLLYPRLHSHSTNLFYPINFIILYRMLSCKSLAVTIFFSKGCTNYSLDSFLIFSLPLNILSKHFCNISSTCNIVWNMTIYNCIRSYYTSHPHFASWKQSNSHSDPNMLSGFYTRVIRYFFTTYLIYNFMASHVYLRILRITYYLLQFESRNFLLPFIKSHY